MALSTYLANKLLDHAIGKSAFTMPTIYVSLFVTNPTAVGSGTECAYTGFARVAAPGASWNAAGSGADSNAATITFGTKTAGTDQAVAFWATFDAATGGNLLEFGPLGASQTISNGNTPSIAAGSFTRTAA